VTVDFLVLQIVNVNGRTAGFNIKAYKVKDGDDGVSIQWIDLGAGDTETSRIENVISN